MKTERILSKTSLKEGFKCEKALYFTLNRPELAEEDSVSKQAQFDEGNEVGELARKHFGKGAIVQTEHFEIAKSLELTQDFIKKGEKTIYEASISDGKLYCRVDILTKPSLKGKWRLIEVKKSLDVKDDHIVDVTVQAVILKRAGIEVESYSVMHLSRECVFPDLDDLFVTEDVTDQIIELMPEMEEKIVKLLDVAKKKSEPKVEIGAQCEKPYGCPYRDHCWAHIPDYSVFDLPGVGMVTGLKYLSKGIVEIKAMSPQLVKNPIQKRVIEVTKSGKRFVDVTAITKEVRGWKHPLYFLDFETVRPAVPRYDGTSSYNQIPYQFSCHVQEKAGGELTHFEYLHLETSDPREPLAKMLAEKIGPKGSVISYNMGFEAGVLKKLAEQFPKYRAALLSIVDRLVDPLPVFRQHVYDREFRGSFSIKDVAPAILGKKFSYDEMEISDGDIAGVWADGILRGKTPSRDIHAIEKNLREYCRKDTLAMAQLVNWLKEL